MTHGIPENARPRGSIMSWYREIRGTKIPASCLMVLWSSLCKRPHHPCRAVLTPEAAPEIRIVW